MNKIAIITGASRGTGAATAQALSERGYKVCINYLSNKDAANEVCSSIEANGGVAIKYQADVSAESEVIDMFEFVNSELGTVTHLVNNVGILFTKTEFSTPALAKEVSKRAVDPSVIPWRTNALRDSAVEHSSSSSSSTSNASNPGLRRRRWCICRA